MSLLPDPEVLLVLGPGILFLMTFAETAVPAGFFVPAGVAVALGAFLAHQGLLTWEGVLIASALGGMAGDSTGYWLGRRGAGPVRARPGRLGGIVRRWERSSARVFRAPALFSVTLARTASFVRTLMPASAGMSGISYPRFLAHEIPGVALWLALYVTVGVVAGESWRVASGMVGGGWAVLLALGGGVAWIVIRRRRRRLLVERVVDATMDRMPQVPEPGADARGLREESAGRGGGQA
jgi:membrane-associated protein